MAVADSKLVPILLSLMLVPTDASSGELGKVNLALAPELSAASHEANAQVLEGLGNLFLALSVRESLEGSGEQELLLAAEAFSSAADRMFQIVRAEAFPDVPLAEFQFLPLTVEPLPEAFFAAETLQNAYITFASRVAAASDEIARLATTPAEERIFGDIYPLVSDVLMFGNAISTVSELLQ